MRAWTGDLTVLVIPGTALLLEGVDHREPTAMREFRTALHRRLGRAQTWRVAVPNGPVPPLLSLGGLGIGVGVRIDRTEGGCVVDPSSVLTGEDLAVEVRRLRADGSTAAARDCEIPIGVAVAVLVALEASRTVRLVPTSPARLPLTAGQTEPLLVPIDFSGAAHPDAPLERRPGAAEFDDRLERALTGPIDTSVLAILHGETDAAAACTDALAAVDLAGAHGTAVAAVDVHHVRYRLIAVDPAEAVPEASGTRVGRMAQSAKQRA
ncbi:MAG: hypothetical protein ACTHVY_00800 [Brevibacterium yomogidense]|uniref:Uncharacterized protein n=1 Tax=Brevibacterium yomogidense TaxID=946573 RepID=A0A1X6XK57_9MICO|nr:MULTISPECIES: hypothetical protein [Brevibacterium]SLM99694.1 hypothetical protein FM105_11655 [Brevibacterium yomogidense]SMX69667.1 hypothetical protein BSP109_00694 [Brevibacterium sp. Mu109]